MTNLRDFRIADIGMHGKIPSEMGLLTNLSTLSLAANLLEGSIPAFVFDRLTNLGTKETVELEWVDECCCLTFRS